MRIKIRNKEHSFTIPLPSGLIYNRYLIGIVLKMVNNSRYTKEHTKEHGGTSITIPVESAGDIAAALKQAKRTLGEEPLVDVKSADGEEVHIML